MFKKIIEGIKQLNRTPVTVDPSRFGDPIAESTAWTPARKGGGSFCTHKLVEVLQHRVEFRATLRMKLFLLGFVIGGLGCTIVFSIDLFYKDAITFNVDTIVPLLIPLFFASLGGCLFYFFTKPIVFDKHSGHFWVGRRDPDMVFNKNSIKVWTQLEKIHALQIISEYCSGGKSSSYYSYELNLVLKDGERINVVDHGNLKKLQEDANTLSNFLGKPVWDAT